MTAVSKATAHSTIESMASDQTASKGHATKMEVTAEAVGFAATLCTCDQDVKISSD
jgi:hypothetical protein